MPDLGINHAQPRRHLLRSDRVIDPHAIGRGHQLPFSIDELPDQLSATSAPANGSPHSTTRRRNWQARVTRRGYTSTSSADQTPGGTPEYPIRTPNIPSRRVIEASARRSSRWVRYCPSFLWEGQQVDGEEDGRGARRRSRWLPSRRNGTARLERRVARTQSLQTERGVAVQSVGPVLACGASTPEPVTARRRRAAQTAKATAKRAAKAKRDPKLIRAWAIDNGIAVPARGRFPCQRHVKTDPLSAAEF